nr:Protein PQN-13, isoform b [Haemonchus contortus]
MKLVVLAFCLGYVYAEGRWSRQSSSCECGSPAAAPVCQCQLTATLPSCQCNAAQQAPSTSCPCAVQAQADQCMPSCQSTCQSGCQLVSGCQQSCTKSCKTACQPIQQNACNTQCLSSCQPQKLPACEQTCQNSCMSDDQYAQQLIQQMSYNTPGMLPTPTPAPAYQEVCSKLRLLESLWTMPIGVLTGLQPAVRSQPMPAAVLKRLRTSLQPCREESGRNQCSDQASHAASNTTMSVHLRDVVQQSVCATNSVSIAMSTSLYTVLHEDLPAGRGQLPTASQHQFVLLSAKL